MQGGVQHGSMDKAGRGRRARKRELSARPCTIQGCIVKKKKKKKKGRVAFVRSMERLRSRAFPMHRYSAFFALGRRRLRECLEPVAGVSALLGLQGWTEADGEHKPRLFSSACTSVVCHRLQSQDSRGRASSQVRPSVDQSVDRLVVSVCSSFLGCLFSYKAVSMVRGRLGNMDCSRFDLPWHDPALHEAVPKSREGRQKATLFQSKLRATHLGLVWSTCMLFKPSIRFHSKRMKTMVEREKKKGGGGGMSRSEKAWST